MQKLYGITKDITALKTCGVPNQRLLDHATNIYYVLMYPRNLKQLQTLQAISGLLLMSHPEDQMTTLTTDHVALIPSEAGIDTTHNTFQAALKLHKHFGWGQFHPLR